MQLFSLSARSARVVLSLLFVAASLVAPARAQLVVQRFRADAGPDRVLVAPANSIVLQGSIEGVKFGSVPLHYVATWTQISGPPAVITNANTLAPTVFPSSTGTVRLRLKVVHTASSSSSDEMSLQYLRASQPPEIGGTLRKWNQVTLTFTHDQTLSESGPVNPFLDLRLVVSFQHAQSGASYVVPGYFAADGNAADSSAVAGTRWRASFTPDRAGTWTFVASFRSGPGVALDPDPDAGQAVSFDGANGSFFVECADPDAPGFLAKGRLDYVGTHHLRFAETHESFLKGGAGSPENAFGYYEFDGTFDLGGVGNDLGLDGLHHFDAHLGDYVDRGVPLWQGTRGRRMFGALSYLAARGVDSLYALSYNVDGGDGEEVWPWISPSNKLRFDVSKLAQWERVLAHMTREGIVWHVVTQETENDHALDGGALGTQRKLYYRELVARFAWAPGLVWNLGEENTNSPEERMAFADYLHALDPYDHPVALHNIVGDLNGTFGPLLGTHLEMCSLQGDPELTPPRAQQLVADSESAGRSWVVNFDEQTPASEGVVPDALDPGHDLIRREALWPMLLAQGGGCEWYFGYANPNADLDCEDFRSRENLWLLTRRALDFLREHVPFTEMVAADELANGNDANVLAKAGEFYLVYLPFGGAVTLDLGASSAGLRVSWFDAANGGSLQDGAVTQVAGPGVVSLGSPPAAGDWVAFVRRVANVAPVIESVTTEPTQLVGGEDFAIVVHAQDGNGPSDLLSGTVEVRTPAGVLAVTYPLVHRGGTLYSHHEFDAPNLAPGTWQLVVHVTDSAGASATQSATFQSL
jgi:hypothetical protein